VRVLAIVPLYPPHHIGGYEVVCRGVMERLSERGHEVVVLTAEHTMEGVETSDPRDGVRVERRLKGWWDWEANGALETTLLDRLRIERHNQRALHEVLQGFAPEVASIWSLVYMSWSLATLLERRSVPTVVTLGDDWICYASELDAWSSMFVRRPRMRPVAHMLGLEADLPTFRGTRVSFASRMIADSVERSCRWSFPGAPVIPMGIETRDFPLALDAENSASGDWGWDLLYVGRVVPAKGVATLMRALGDLPSRARLDIDGYCAPTEHLRLSAEADQLGVADRVRFSHSPRMALAERYRRADTVVFPSEWPEPFGLVPLEAMACGTPVVATGTGGSGEFLVDGVNCLLFPPGDAGALAGAIRRLASDGELRRRVVAGGIHTAQAMTVDAYTERLEKLHLEAASRSSVPGPSEPDTATGGAPADGSGYRIGGGSGG